MVRGMKANEFMCLPVSEIRFFKVVWVPVNPRER